MGRDGGDGLVGTLHHVEVWVRDLEAARARWAWLLGRLGYEPYRSWAGGVSHRCGAIYVVLEHSPALVGSRHERRAPGVNHLAFHAGPRDAVDAVAQQASAHGWRLMFADAHPWAGGPDHYAAYLEDDDGHEVELVAERSGA